jgi:hypothetical protein
MNRFLHSLSESANAFRSEALRASNECQQIESEYKVIKKRTDPLLQNVKRPPRDNSGLREARLAEQRNTGIIRQRRIRTVPERKERKLREPTPVAVLHFKTESFSAFRASAEALARSQQLPSPHSLRRSQQEIPEPDDEPSTQ